MGVIHWCRRLWAGQIPVSNRAAAAVIAAVVALWVWAGFGGLSAPPTPGLIVALVWIYAVGAIMVASATAAVVAVRLIVLNLQSRTRPAENVAVKSGNGSVTPGFVTPAFLKPAFLKPAWRRPRKQEPAERASLQTERRDEDLVLAGRRSGREANLDGRHFRTGR
jgi:hypothetical protein